MKTKKGFTLIELLVVIAIIALLMSILMPALASVKRKAKDISCIMNLKSWGSSFSMYLADHDNNYMNGKHKWFYALRSYYGAQLEQPTPTQIGEVKRRYKIRFCPLSMKFGDTYNIGSTQYTEGEKQPYAAWMLLPTEGGNEEWMPYYWDGSYGTNSWIYNETGYIQGWKNSNVSNTDTIPVLLDSALFGGRPEEQDERPAFRGEISNAPAKGFFMKQFCATDRHTGNVNALFMDASVRPVNLKELYTLKWHRRYNTCDIYTLCGNRNKPAEWPDWMVKLKDY